MTAAGIVRHGAFYPADAFLVAVVSFGLIVACLFGGFDRRTTRVALALSACTLWWLFSAAFHGRGSTFLPLGASMVGFLAAFVVIRPLDENQRVLAAQILATIGAVTAAISLAASVMRWYPVAMPAQGLWRLAST